MILSATPFVTGRMKNGTEEFLIAVRRLVVFEKCNGRLLRLTGHQQRYEI